MSQAANRNIGYTLAALPFSAMESPSQERTRAAFLPTETPKAVHGPRSLLAFCGAFAAFLFFRLTASYWHLGYPGGLAYIGIGLVFGCCLCMVSTVLAIIGLRCREQPRWPAIAGLALSVLPASGGLCLIIVTLCDRLR